MEIWGIGDGDSYIDTVMLESLERKQVADEPHEPDRLQKAVASVLCRRMRWQGNSSYSAVVDQDQIAIALIARFVQSAAIDCGLPFRCDHRKVRIQLRQLNESPSSGTIIVGFGSSLTKEPYTKRIWRSSVTRGAFPGGCDGNPPAYVSSFDPIRLLPTIPDPQPMRCKPSYQASTSRADFFRFRLCRVGFFDSASQRPTQTRGRTCAQVRS